MPLLLLWPDAALASDRTAEEVGARVIALGTRLVDEIGPRPARSEGAERAQRWVEAELAPRGWPAHRVEGGVPEGSVLACRGPAARDVDFLALAHTDAVHADVPGANDNAAAVAALLVAAEELGEPDRLVCLGFPGGEEIGLHGSRALARHVRPRLVVALDLVGRGTPTWNGLGPAWGTDRLRALLAVAPLDVPWAYRAISHGLPRMERSDHLPFAATGVPALHLMARGESGVYLAYHTAQDTPDQLEAGTLGVIVDTVVTLAALELPDEPLGDPAMVIPGTPTVIPGSVVRVTAAGGALLGVFGAVGAVPWKAELWGWLRTAGASVVASLVAAALIAVAEAGRDLGMALTGPALAIGWMAWTGAALAWPWPAPAATGRRFAALLSATWAGALTAGGLFLLAWPSWVLLACVLLARVAPIPAAALSLGVAGYFLSPDHARELAFHGMVPASPVAWAVLWLLLASPAVGLVQGRALPRSARALGLGLIALAALGAAASWTLDAYALPFSERAMLPPGR